MNNQNEWVKVNSLCLSCEHNATNRRGGLFCNVARYPSYIKKQCKGYIEEKQILECTLCGKHGKQVSYYALPSYRYVTAMCDNFPDCAKRVVDNIAIPV